MTMPRSKAFACCLGLSSGAPLPAERIATVKMGTTVATNALLERKGQPTLLVITKGLKDQLEIGYQARADIFAKKIIKPEMLYSRVVEANERVRADGTVEQPLDTAALEAELNRAAADGIGSVAIVLMHSYAYPAHERQAADLARRGRLHADLRQPRSLPPHQARRPRRHHGGGRLPLPHPPPPRGEGGACAVFLPLCRTSPSRGEGRGEGQPDTPVSASVCPSP